jgi:hypothetical protein
MKKTIWKFILEVKDFQTFEMPIYAEILSVQMQVTHGCLWALVDPNAEIEERHFEIFGTGNPVGCDMGIDRRYIGSYQTDGGMYVWHVFERLN